jgi:ATP-dependent DNA helicase RecG
MLKKINNTVMKTIFISSPQKEFATERQALKAYLQGDPLFRRFFNVFLFEDLPANDRKPNDVYLEEVDRCGIYLGLFGNDYGPEDAVGLSATEKEFDRATKRGKHRLIYVKGTKAAVRHPKMQALIAKADAQLIRRRFGTLPELTAALYASLVEYLEKKRRFAHGPVRCERLPKGQIE